jgi:predicted DNA-binding transcriptional regulator AlpA
MTILLTKKETARRVGLHPESVMRMVREGRFIQPIRTGPTDHHSVRFLESEVDGWVEAMTAARDSVAIKEDAS